MGEQKLNKYHDITNNQMVHRFVINTIADIADIPAEKYSPGSICIVADSGDRYMLNLDYKWIRQPAGSGGSGGTDEDVIYDGKTPEYWS